MNLTLALTIIILSVMVLSMQPGLSMRPGLSITGRPAPAGPAVISNASSAASSTVSVSASVSATATATATSPASSTVTTQPPAPSTLGHFATPGDSDVEQRGSAALAEISYPWQQMLPGWKIEFHEAETGAYGYTLTRESHINIYVRADQSHELLSHVVAHEIGHAVDVTLNDGDDRRHWQEARRISEAPWWPNNRAADFATGAGDFAESFAAWQVGPSSFRSQLGGPPNEAEIAVLVELARA